MTTLVAVGRRVLPRGWGDLAKQLAIWFGFLFAYQAARGIADRNPPKAFDNGLKVIGFERHTHALHRFENRLQICRGTGHVEPRDPCMILDPVQ